MKHVLGRGMLQLRWALLWLAVGCTQLAPAPPVISVFSSSTSSGPAPLNVSFTWTIADANQEFMRCELDINYNGTAFSPEYTIGATPPIEGNSCTSANTRAHTYAPGTYKAVLRVCDSTAGPISTAATAPEGCTQRELTITVNQSTNNDPPQIGSFVADPNPITTPANLTTTFKWAGVIDPNLDSPLSCTLDTDTNAVGGEYTFSPCSSAGSQAHAYTVGPKTRSARFSVSDGRPGGTTTRDITVTLPNNPPVANPLALTTAEDTPISATLTGSDVNGDTLLFSTSGETNGTLTSFNANTGTFTFTPTANFNGNASFSFTVSDGTTTSVAATVSIVVTAVNDAPVGTAQTISTNEDVAISGTVSATDVDGTVVSYAATSPVNGTLTTFNTATGAFTFTPTANFNGTASFSYTATDNAGATSTPVTVTINVLPINDVPVATNDTYSTPKNTALNVNAVQGILANDTDADTGTVLQATSVSALSDPSAGTLNVNNNGSFTFTPATDYVGTVTFTYRANDGTALSNTATVTLTVTAPAASPAAKPKGP